MSRVLIAQFGLNKHYQAGLTEDGIPGPATSTALIRVPSIPTEWSDDRKVVAMIQHFATLEGVDAGTMDGLWGPQTEYAYDQLTELRDTGSLPGPWRQDEFLGDSLGGRWPMQNEADMNAFFGEVGTNQGKCNSPYPLKLAWAPDTVVNRFTCHEKVAPIIESILNKVLDYYGLEEIQRLRLDMWGGALNVRKMRGGTKWSTHSWGTSVDWDPENNKLKWGKDKATLARPEYDFWWKCWEDEGAVSLGREQDRDWMHVQFARLR